jgi:hypothetical protein
LGQVRVGMGVRSQHVFALHMLQSDCSPNTSKRCMTLWQKEPNVVIFQFVKGVSLPWQYLNECMHHKWCVCDPMMEWSKGDYLSTHENPCEWSHLQSLAKGKLKVWKPFLVFFIYFCKFWTCSLGVLGTSHTMPIDGSRRMRTCKHSFTTQCVHVGQNNRC